LFTRLINIANGNVLSATLGRFFNAHTVGCYGTASSWNDKGCIFVNGMVNAVAQPVLTEISGDTDRQLAVFRKMLRFASFLSFPLMLGFALISHEFIVLAGTAKWLESIPLLRILCVWGAFVPVSTLYTNLILSKGRSGLYMWITLTQCVVQLLSVVLFHRYGVSVMVTVFVCINLGWLLIWHYFVQREIGLTIRCVLKDTLPFLGITLLTLGVAWLCARPFTSLGWILAVKVAVAVPLYIFLLWMSNAVIFRECILFFNKQLRKKR
jgi:O-antigen/teichoic acid export membrane protein